MIFPQKVLLRCARPAVVNNELRSNADELGPWKYQGKTDNDQVQLWRADGRWREDGSAHPLDIVGIYDGQNHVSAFAAAAGQKGPQ